ncbi:hypothetical protein SNEBB_009133 [Seison nebaliae]|nr:hypothetical protein SNEBB_009133 [Seison nebaliae]
MNSQDKCMLCEGDLEISPGANEPTTNLRCNHSFHTSCLQTYQDSNTEKCPSCVRAAAPRAAAARAARAEAARAEERANAQLPERLREPETTSTLGQTLFGLAIACENVNKVTIKLSDNSILIYN